MHQSEEGYDPSFQNNHPVPTTFSKRPEAVPNLCRAYPSLQRGELGEYDRPRDQEVQKQPLENIPEIHPGPPVCLSTQIS